MGKLTNNVLTIVGKSGKKYTFKLYTIDTKFKPLSAIYLFTERYVSTNNKYNHNLIYCGMTGDLSIRFKDHHKDGCIEKHNANCICIFSVDTEKERKEIETDILEAKSFLCNEVLN